MGKLTIALGFLLGLVGFGFFASTGFAKYTALIPVPFALFFIGLGWWAFSDRWRKFAMHISSFLSLVGTLPLFMVVLKLLQGKDIVRPLATVEMAMMGGLCLVYLVLCVRYFLAQRAKKKQGNA